MLKEHLWNDLNLIPQNKFAVFLSFPCNKRKQTQKKKEEFKNFHKYFPQHFLQDSYLTDKQVNTEDARKIYKFSLSLRCILVYIFKDYKRIISHVISEISPRAFAKEKKKNEQNEKKNIIWFFHIIILACYLFCSVVLLLPASMVYLNNKLGEGRVEWDNSQIKWNIFKFLNDKNKCERWILFKFTYNKHHKTSFLILHSIKIHTNDAEIKYKNERKFCNGN